MLLRRLFTVILLALLIFMQGTSLAHSTEHLLAGEDSHCVECAFGQQFKEAVTSKTTNLGAVIQHSNPTPASGIHAAAFSPAVFQSRAPPRSLN